MEITPPNHSLLELLARWAWHGVIGSIKLGGLILVVWAAIALLISTAKLLWFFINLLLRAIGGG